MIISYQSILVFIKVDSIRRQRFRIAALIWITIALFMITARDVPAISTDSSVESIGVNTQWAYSKVHPHNYTGLKAK
jgi:hypothetical protein